MSKHTPTPWSINAVKQLRSAEGEKIRIEGAAFSGLTDREAEANSALIVRAVNSHDDLLEVAQSILADDLLPLLPTEYIAKVRAAIAKATE